MPVTSLEAEALAVIGAQWDETTGSLLFTRGVKSRTVHVVGDFNRVAEKADLGGEGVWLAVRRLHEASLCGRFIALPNPFDRLVSEFEDTDLCRRCHQALGALADLAFEHDTADSGRR